MRLDRALIVARKDLAEFRRNRYILASILAMPLLIAVVLPMVYVVPIKMLASEKHGSIDLEFDIVARYSNTTISNATLFDVELSNVSVTNCVVQRSVMRDCTLTRSSINGSEVTRSKLVECVVTQCNLADLLEERDNTVIGSEYLGDDEELEALKSLLFNMLLLLLIIIPVMIPTVTASYSFVGEKVNRSLEPLLATPATDLELLTGKSASIFLISMAATWLAAVLCIITVNTLTEPVLGYYPLPNAYWMLGIIILAPAMCLMSILTNVLVSSKVSDVRVSQQVGGVLVPPVLAFFFSSMLGVLASGIVPMLLFSLAIFAVDGGILYLSLKVFRREEILVRWK